MSAEMSSPWIEPLVMAGGHAQLLPLAWEHEAALCDAVRDGELWKLWYTAVPSPEGMKAEIERRLKLQAQGLMLPFTVEAVPEVDVEGGKVVVEPPAGVLPGGETKEA